MQTRMNRRPDPEIAAGLRGPEIPKRKPGTPAVPEDAEGRAKKPSGESREDDPSPTSETRRNVTNHDEQNKIVNSDDGAMGEKETEGE